MSRKAEERGKPDYSVAEKELPDVLHTSQDEVGAYRWLQQISIRFWIWEFLSLMTSTACMSAILAILAHYDGKPMPNWSYGLTMNGVISVLAGKAKSATVLPLAAALSQLKWCWFWTR